MRLYDHPTYGGDRPGPQTGRILARTQSWGGLNGGWPSARAPLSTAPKIVADITAKQPVSTLIQTGVQGIGKLPAVAMESAPMSDAPAASRFALTRPGIAVPVVADQPFQLGNHGDNIQGEFTQAPGPGTFTSGGKIARGLNRPGYSGNGGMALGGMVAMLSPLVGLGMIGYGIYKRSWAWGLGGVGVGVAGPMVGGAAFVASA